MAFSFFANWTNWFKNQKNSEEWFESEPIAGIQKSGKALQFIPDSEKTYEICLTACLDNWLALEWVPENIKTEKFLCEILRKHGIAVKMMDPDKLTEKMALAAATNFQEAFRYIPASKRTREVWIEIILLNWDEWKYNGRIECRKVPSEYLDLNFLQQLQTCKPNINFLWALQNLHWTSEARCFSLKHFPGNIRNLGVPNFRSSDIF